jgi:ubiquinone/menaquinone biosynthesis C-methylase UbiE
MTEPTKKELLRAVFDLTAEGYAAIRYFPIFGQWLVDMAQIPAGAKVLDVACGRGAVLYPAAERTGPGGQVIGIDLSEGMAQETNAEIQRLNLKQAEARAMDAEHLEFPDGTFDYVLCGFSLQFLPNLTEALLGFKRVLKPGGHVAVTTWGDEDNRWSWFDELRNSYRAVLKLGSQSLDKPEEIKRWFSQAGFVDIKIITKDLDMIYADEGEWWNMQSSISGRAGLEKLDAAALEKFKAETFARMQAHREADGFHDRLQAHCTIARRP